MSALHEAALHPFVERLADALSRELPRETAELGRAGLMRSIRANLEKARGFGIETQRDAYRFLRLSLCWPGFCEPGPEGIVACLGDPDLSGTSKLDLLEYRFYVLGERRPHDGHSRP